MGLFTNILNAVNNRIVGTARSTAGGIKNRILSFDIKGGGFYRNNAGKLGKLVESDFDARAMSGRMAKNDFSELGVYKISSIKKTEQNPSIKYYVRLDYKNHIEGMPPMADNIVDPPPFMQESMYRSNASSWESGLVGKKYAKLVMERGNYLSLTPLKLDPSPITNMIFGSGRTFYKILTDDLWGSVNIPNYGFEANIAVEDYWRDVCVHARASLMLLGLGEYTTEDMKVFLPDHICAKLADRFSILDGGLYSGPVDQRSWGQKLTDGLGLTNHKLTNESRNLTKDTAKGTADAIKGIKALTDAKTHNNLANANSKKSTMPDIKAVSEDYMLGDNNYWDQRKNPVKGKKGNPYPLSKFGKKANELAKKLDSGKSFLQSKYDQLQKGYNDFYNKAKASAEKLDKMTDQYIKKASEGMRAFMGTHGGDMGLALYDRFIGSGIEQVTDSVKQVGENIMSTVINGINGKFDKMPGVTSLYQAGGPHDLNDQSAINFMKYILNTTPESLSKGFPFVSFYCDGPIEKNYSSSLDISESELSAATVQYWKDSAANAANTALSGLTKGIFNLDNETLKDSWKELRFHNYADGKWVGFNMSSQIVIPKIIKGSSLGESYTANIRLIAVGTDRWSLFRLHFAICKLIPFFVPKNEQDSMEKYIIPQQPFYCSAFSKGVMNLPRAAIENISIKTDATYNTTEGIASDITISINLIPLLNVATSPKIGRFGSNDTPEAIITSMFNPASSFNMLATLAGHNTVFTRIPLGLFEYFVVGKPRAYYENVTNIMRIASNAYQDYSANSNFNYKRKLLTR
nr:MAG TPA: hypothetical protein [Caudoviricetes sp.]